MEKFGLSDRIRIAKESTATVALAAKAFDCEEKKIAKTLSFMLPSGPILVLAVGDARIDNAKFKHTFAAKAKMIKPEECEQINEDVKVYLDESLKSMDSVLPACGTSDTGIELTIPELEKSSCCTGWVDITKTLD